jgi:hypothetical protein
VQDEEELPQASYCFLRKVKIGAQLRGTKLSVLANIPGNSWNCSYVIPYNHI